MLSLEYLYAFLISTAKKADLARTRSFERLLAKEHEAAALGRATATIAHEVRNPLNAINMGLQRLTLESAVLDEDQRALIVAMEEAVRAAAIISELQRFTRKLQPRLQPLDPAKLLQQMLLLYQQRRRPTDHSQRQPTIRGAQCKPTRTCWRNSWKIC